MIEAVKQFINQHGLIKHNKTMIVGVSGGPDSMALLHILKSLQDVYQLKIIALCINHQLRGEEAHKEVIYVKEICEAWDISFITEEIDVNTYKNTHTVSTQMAARHLRYKCYKKHIEQQAADYLALGHHADDQIETMFMALSQVTDPGALSGIPVKRPFGEAVLIRPLLCVTKKAINNYCRKHKIHPQFDPSNEDDRYLRIYYRKYIVPKVKKRHHNVHRTIQYLSETLREDEQYLMNQAKDIFQSPVIKIHNDKKVSFSIEQFKRYSRSLQRRIYQLILDYLYKEIPKNISYVHEKMFLALLQEKKSNVRFDFPHTLRLEKAYDDILFYFHEEQEQPYFHKVVDIPSVIHLPNGATLTLTFINDIVDDVDHYTYICSANSMSFPLHIRTRKPGDRMSWKGLKGSKKIKDIFIDEKISRQQRDELLLLTDNDGTVLWIIGVKKGLPQFKSTQSSQYIKIVYDENVVQ